jgi:hypothetical protein
MQRLFFSITIFVVVVIVFVNPDSGTAQNSLQVKTNSETGQWLISENDKPVLQYNYAVVPLPDGYWNKVKDSSYKRTYAVPRSNYIHPLYDLDGNPITKDWSEDHPHHRGIYWAWPEVGYKNEFGDLHALQKVFARPTGKIEDVTENGQIKLVAENVWKWFDEEPIVNEQTIITVSPLDQNGRKINLEFRFNALVDGVTLARRQRKFYGGLNIRMLPLKDFKIGSFYDNEKDVSQTEQPAWVCASWKNPDTESQTELTVFEKSSNPDYPGELYKYPEINWFQPTFPKKETRYALKKNEPLILRYQLWLHNAADDDNAKKESWKNFQNKK